MNETKTQQAVRLRAAGLSYAEIASAIGSTVQSVGTLLYCARAPKRRREYARQWDAKNPDKVRESKRRYLEKLTPEQRAERNFRRKCREAGVNPD